MGKVRARGKALTYLLNRRLYPRQQARLQALAQSKASRARKLIQHRNHPAQQRMAILYRFG